MDLKTRRAVARELLNAADTLDNEINAVKKIRKRMTKSDRMKMQRDAKKRGERMGRKIWVEVTQQPKKGKGGKYIGYANFRWQKDSDKKSHSVMINVGDKPAKLSIRSRDLMVKPQGGGDPYKWADEEKKKKKDEEKKPSDKKADRKKAMQKVADEVMKSDIGKKAMEDLKNGKTKAAEKLVKQLDDSLGKGNEASKVIQDKIDGAKKGAKPKKEAPKKEKKKGGEKPEDQGKKKPKKKELTEKDYAKSAPVKNLMALHEQGNKDFPKYATEVADEIDKRLGKESDLTKDLRRKAKLFGTEEKFMKSAPVKNAQAALSKATDKNRHQANELAKEVAQQVDDRLGPDNRVSKKLWEDIRKNVQNMKAYEDKVSRSAPVKNVEKMLKEGQAGAHNAAKDLIVALEKRLGPDAGLTKHIKNALDDSRKGAGGRYEDYNTWKARLKEEGKWDEKRGQPKD